MEGGAGTAEPGEEVGEDVEVVLRACPVQEGRSLVASEEQTEVYEAGEQKREGIEISSQSTEHERKLVC